MRLDKDTGQRELTGMRWGLVPYWSKDAKIAYSTIHAKAETVATSPAFKEAMKRRRCLVPADWFYEWQKSMPRQSSHMPSAEGWLIVRICWPLGPLEGSGDRSEAVETFTIITTEPNELMQTLHNRMPVILRPDDYDRWLETWRTGTAAEGSVATA